MLICAQALVITTRSHMSTSNNALLRTLQALQCSQCRTQACAHIDGQNSKLQYSIAHDGQTYNKGFSYNEQKAKNKDGLRTNPLFYLQRSSSEQWFVMQMLLPYVSMKLLTSCPGYSQNTLWLFQVPLPERLYLQAKCIIFN